MLIKGITEEDFVNYKLPSMFIAFPYCSFKCGKELCQNSPLALACNIDVSIDDIINRYNANPITKAIVLGGLEPFDSYKDMFELIQKFRERSVGDIVIYTGYTEEELEDKIPVLSRYHPLIIKFGRFVPNCEYHYDEVLGVQLASPNQYGKRIEPSV